MHKPYNYICQLFDLIKFSAYTRDKVYYNFLRDVQREKLISYIIFSAMEYFSIKIYNACNRY